MTGKQKLAFINAVIAANAASLGQEPTIRATMLGKKVRVGTVKPGERHLYPDIDTAVDAAIAAFGRAVEQYQRYGRSAK